MFGVSQSPLTLRQRRSRASSVASDNASIFSMGSNSSWQSSIHDALGAAEMFRVILLQDAELKPVFNIARNSLDIRTFKVELHRMLREYSQDLVKKAQAPIERTAIKFVRKFRRKIACQVGENLYEDESGPSASQVRKSTPQDPSESENSSSEEDDEYGADFQRMRGFLLDSLAFKTLKTQLVLFLRPCSEYAQDKPVLKDTVGFKSGLLDGSLIQTEDDCATDQDLDLNNMEHGAEIEKSSTEITIRSVKSLTITQLWVFWLICMFNGLYSFFLKF